MTPTQTRPATRTPRRRPTRLRRRRAFVIATCLSTTALVGCGDPTGVRVEDLAGSWTMIAGVATNPADPSETEDVVAAGVALTMEIGADGSLSLTLEAGGLSEVEVGTVTIDDPSITLVLGGDTTAGTFSLDGNRLTLDLRIGVEWDFGGDGIDEPATLQLTLRRS